MAHTSIGFPAHSAYSLNDIPLTGKLSTVSSKIRTSLVKITRESGDFDSINDRISENETGIVESRMMRLVSGFLNSVELRGELSLIRIDSVL